MFSWQCNHGNKGRTMRKLIGRAEYQKIFAQGKLKWKKILARQLILKKYSCYGLKNIHTRNLITKKKFLRLEKLPPPRHPDNFSNGPSLKKGSVHAYQMKTVTEDALFQKRLSEWRVLKTPASRLRVGGRKRSWCQTSCTSCMTQALWEMLLYLYRFSVFAWTGEHLRFQKYPHTCGRGLSVDKQRFYMVNCEWSLLHLRSVWNMKTYTRDLIKAKLVLSETKTF